MAKRVNINEVNRILENKGYELIGDYINTRIKVSLRDNEGYYYYTTIDSLKSGSTPSKFHITNPYTMQNIKLFCKDKPYEVLSDIYMGKEIEYELKCKNEGCRETFSLTWHAMIVGTGCGYCVGRRVSLSNCLATTNPDILSEWHPTLNKDLTPYDITKGSHEKVWWKCENKNHKPWIAQIKNRVIRGDGCPYCSGNKVSEENNLLVHFPKMALEWDYEKNKRRPEEFASRSHKRVWWKCSYCNESWNTQIATRTNTNSIGCSICNSSKGERIIRDFLMKNKIIYKDQVGYDGLVGLGGGNLSYDFYLPDYNMLIEFQGQFHDGSSGDYSRFNLDRQKAHDTLKRSYAINQGIDLLEIWYWDFDNIETILEEELKINNDELQLHS